MPPERGGEGVGVGCPGHQMGDASIFDLLMGSSILFPRDWLHRLQMVRPLSGLFVPPSVMGMMWSGSALLGFRDTS